MVRSCNKKLFDASQTVVQEMETAVILFSLGKFSLPFGFKFICVVSSFFLTIFLKSLGYTCCEVEQQSLVTCQENGNS